MGKHAEVVMRDPVPRIYQRLPLRCERDSLRIVSPETTTRGDSARSAIAFSALVSKDLRIVS